MRRSEQISLTRADIKSGVAILRHTKNGRPRSVPLSSRARAVLAELPTSGKLFPVSRNEIVYHWKRALRDANVHGLRWHDLRHEAVSRLFEKGLTTEEVMVVSGHTTYAMLARYTHLRAEGIARKLG